MQYSTNSIMNLISHLHSQSQDFINRQLSAQGLKELASSHGKIIYFLSQQGQMSLGELSKSINRDKSTTTVLVRKLEGSGLVELKKDENDSRKKIITLTREGTKYTKTMEEISRQLLVTSWKDFKPKEQTQLLGYLTKLSENLK